ncbi:MAG TPA: hypothetical protein VFN01_00460 [Marinobacter sp.]|uniref:hypothetical protein n=1 Tax=Marinobacter sp. TaxID=50741 RepID=UPI002D807665|nr:hypothetical protein [Marinobacter sp.]HET8799629.1 hypothetical protein [Marinobacter sp.]
MAGQQNQLSPEQKAAQEAEQKAKQEAEEKARLEAEQRAGTTTSNRVAVTFVKPYSRYSRGDIAGFTTAEAERLVKGRVAVRGTKLPAKKADQNPEPKA